MNIGAIFTGIAVLVGAIAYVARPLYKLSPQVGQEDATKGESRAGIIARRDAIYALVRELDADHQTGKVSNQDYETLRKRYVAEGVSVLKQLDALPGSDNRDGLENEIEARVLALRRTHSAPRTTSRGATTQYCSQCGNPTDPEDRFCAHCGTPVKEAVGE